ncbi:hypothetical protein [Nostoc sp. UIC 10630]|uniref:hypothetical protein n=1 Tax=Nostoc sp. UIC 10630 TaxID=2100146 RepID=UPI0013D0CF1C|nr:hypothetical protein [Nostoc sp. UIC 10630]NEU81352.1 hypothetical protein [Nostoc sp. UIC 10630]
MDLEQFTTLIHKHGLSEYQDEILAGVRPAVLLRLGQVEPGHKGQSRDAMETPIKQVAS